MVKVPNQYSPALLLLLRFTFNIPRTCDLAPGYLKILMAKLTPLTYLLHTHTQAVETTAKTTVCHFPHIRINDTCQGTKDKKKKKRLIELTFKNIKSKFIFKQ